MFDRNDPDDLLELKNEVSNDPTGLGYAAVVDQTSELLALLNGKNPLTLVAKPKVSAAAIRTATTFDAFDGLLNPEQDWLTWLTGSNGFDEENLDVTPELRQKLAGDPITNASIWAAADRTLMNAEIQALIDVPGSRAEVLWGFDTVITSADWFAARDS